MAVTATIGFLNERIILRPILGQSAVAIVMVTIGFGYMARGLVTMIPVIGTDTHTPPFPSAVRSFASPASSSPPSTSSSSR